MLLVDNVDNREFLTELLTSMYDELPEPKNKEVIDFYLLILFTMRNRNHIRDRYLGKRRSLIVKRKILFCIVIMLLTGIVLAQASSIAEGIASVTGNYDARVKLRETPRGKVIGQYYTGAHYTADEEKDGWVHVTIGGRSGWMMKSYLKEGDFPAYYAQTGRIAYPESDGCIGLIDLEGKEHRIPENTFLYVLGTIGDTYVHVEAHLQDNEILYCSFPSLNIQTVFVQQEVTDAHHQTHILIVRWKTGHQS